MSESQCRLVEEHLWCAYYTMKFMQADIPPHLYEDCLSTAKLTLCKCAIAYQNNYKAKFSTYAINAMRVEVRHFLEKEQREIRKEEKLTRDAKSLVVYESYDEDTHHYCLSDRARISLFIDSLLDNKIDDVDTREALLLIAAGYTLPEISEKLNIRMGPLNWKLKKLKMIMSKSLEKDGKEGSMAV
ncbi:hypothetical protein [Agathobaculum desmolans]|uniref:hypothetical protein n=1 Tax=Agathobaculum desmolans TaxID=39484 RepID=UPI00248DF4E9|nr:hypothetical protein [Agathobaculum desmolans]